jgi:hypothetical protein
VCREWEVYAADGAQDHDNDVDYKYKQLLPVEAHFRKGTTKSTFHRMIKTMRNMPMTKSCNIIRMPTPIIDLELLSI